jgi:hypothetical protein
MSVLENPKHDPPHVLLENILAMDCGIVYAYDDSGMEYGVGYPKLPDAFWKLYWSPTPVCEVPNVNAPDPAANAWVSGAACRANTITNAIRAAQAECLKMRSCDFPLRLERLLAEIGSMSHTFHFLPH